MHKINHINCGFVTVKAKWTDLAAVAFYYPKLTVKKKKIFLRIKAEIIMTLTGTTLDRL